MTLYGGICVFYPENGVFMACFQFKKDFKQVEMDKM